MQQVEPQADIRRRFATANRIALLQQCGEVGGHGLLPLGLGRRQHARQPRMGAEPGHAPARRGDPPGAVQRIQLRQQRARRGHGAGGRRVQPGERVRRRPPGGEVEGEARQLLLQDRRPVLRRQAAVQRLRPQPDRNTRRGAAGAAGALLGGGLADPHGDEARQAGGGIEPRRPAEAAIDHDPHAGDGEGRLGDRGRQHHLAPRAGVERQVLLGRRHLAMQRADIGLDPGEPLGGAADLAPAGQEGEDIAFVRLQRNADRPGHRLRQVARVLDVARAVLDAHRVGAAEAGDGRGVRQRPIAHQRREGAAIQRRRHRQQPQLRPQRALQVEAEGERQVGVEVALMRLVEQHGGNAIQPGVGLQPAHQQPLGHHLHPGAVGDGAVEPRGEADGAARGGLADQLGHPPRRGPGGDAAGFEDQDLPPRRPGLVLQDQRDQRGLAGARRGDEQGVGAVAQRRGQRRQRLNDGQIGEHAAAYRAAADALLPERLRPPRPPPPRPPRRGR